MALYTRKDFLKYYDFKDEPNYFPETLLKKRNFFTKLLEDIPKSIKKGTRIQSAFMLYAGISRPTYWKWHREFEKEVSEGKIDTPLIRLFLEAYKADVSLEEELMELGINLAKSGDVKMLQYIMTHRLGFKETNKTEVEISAAEEAPVKFVIGDMTPLENDEDD